MPSQPDLDLRNRSALRNRRRELRRKATLAETLLWECLRRRALHGRKFRRQYSIGPYVLDFYCPEEQLGIEIDGTVHQDPWRYEYEEERTTFFITQGIRFARFENRQVLEQRAVVLEAIAWHFRNTPTEEEAYLPSPPPSQGGGLGWTAYLLIPGNPNDTIHALGAMPVAKIALSIPA